jgi:ABC-type glycerol-3-phosphate transport system permease component
MYLLLTVGALTMLYPFGLMFSIATTSQADYQEFRLIPQYWHDDIALFKKYIVDVADMENLAVWFNEDKWFAPINVSLEQLKTAADVPEQNRQIVAEDWWEFLSEKCPSEFKLAAFVAGETLDASKDGPFALFHEYMEFLEDKYKSIEKVNAAYIDTAEDWPELGMPSEHEQLDRQPHQDQRFRDWREFIESRAPHRTGLFDVDSKIFEFLVGRFGNAEQVSEHLRLIELPFSVELGSETLTHFMQDSNGYVELLKAGELPYGFGAGEVARLVEQGDPDKPRHTYLMAAYDDLDSSTDGEFGYRFGDGATTFYWNTPTAKDAEAGIAAANSFQIVLRKDGSVQWNFGVSQASGHSNDLFSGIYLGYDAKRMVEIAKGKIPEQKSWRLPASAEEADPVAVDVDFDRSDPESWNVRQGGDDTQAGGIGKLTEISYDDLFGGRLGADIKREFFKQNAPMRFVKVDVEKAEEAWRAFLKKESKDPDLVLDERMPHDPKRAGSWSLFVQKACPLEALDVARPETEWWSYLNEKYKNVSGLNDAHGTQHAAIPDNRIGWTQAQAQYQAFLRDKSSIWWRYLTTNFVTVFKFVAVHGHALKVTAFYIILLIGTTLTINPLAAYALSRFQLKETHHVLVFLLATMAFPGEVLMIPNFLLIKSFPFWQFLTVGVCVGGFILLRHRLGSAIPFLPGFLVTLGIAALAAGWLLPKLGEELEVDISLNLLNTYWALVLPALANGYGIFLLKGFFDSLPPELYEAGLIDGASEIRMFAQITFPLCKPIMAVMALAAFTSAYGAFMHAFLVCQDPKMWTLMVFLYEFQQNHTLPLVMASLVIAAIPTLIVFILCQRVILRGIVIPTFK